MRRRLSGSAPVLVTPPATGCAEEKARALLAAAGFASVDVFHVEGDPLNAYYVCGGLA